jgi:hypothetical protein
VDCDNCQEIEEGFRNGRKWHEDKAKGVKGLLPLGCLPLWGREGSPSYNLHQKTKKGAQEDFLRTNPLYQKNAE